MAGRISDIGEIPGRITRYGKYWYFTHFFFTKRITDANDMISRLKKHNPGSVYIKVPYTLQTYDQKRKAIDEKCYAIYERDARDRRKK